MAAPKLMEKPHTFYPCIVLIGMAGTGKTTVGTTLARQLGWSFLDTDHLIEATYGTRLQDVTDALGKEAFLDVESTVVQAIRAHRAVIGTGGSVIYREKAMAHLASLGSIVHLDLPLAIIEERIARNPQRGLAIAPGQTLADLVRERAPLYKKYASLTCPCEGRNPQECATWILQHLPKNALTPTDNGKSC